MEYVMVTASVNKWENIRKYNLNQHIDFKNIIDWLIFERERWKY